MEVTAHNVISLVYIYCVCVGDLYQKINAQRGRLLLEEQVNNVM